MVLLQQRAIPWIHITKPVVRKTDGVVRGLPMLIVIAKIVSTTTSCALVWILTSLAKILLVAVATRAQRM